MKKLDSYFWVQLRKINQPISIGRHPIPKSLILITPYTNVIGPLNQLVYNQVYNRLNTQIKALLKFGNLEI